MTSSYHTLGQGEQVRITHLRNRPWLNGLQGQARPTSREQRLWPISALRFWTEHERTRFDAITKSSTCRSRVQVQTSSELVGGCVELPPPGGAGGPEIVCPKLSNRAAMSKTPGHLRLAVAACKLEWIVHGFNGRSQSTGSEEVLAANGRLYMFDT